LVAVLASDILLALALSRAHNASGIVQSTQGVASTGLAALGIIQLQIPVTIFALVTTTSRDEGLAMAGASCGAVFRIVDRVADTVVQRTFGIAVTGLANTWGIEILLGIAVEERHTLLAVLSLGVVQAVVAHSAGN